MQTPTMGFRRRVNRWSSTRLEQFPEIYRMAMLIRHRNKPFVRSLVTRGHHLMIEGYPRSGNSFASRAFSYSNGWRGPHLATHAHSPAHVILALKYNVPAMVLIRDPVQSISSLIAHGFRGNAEKFAAQPVSYLQYLVGESTQRYVRFYERLLPYREDVLRVTFDEVTSDFGQVLSAFNKKFGTDFDVFQHTDENVQKIFAMSQEHLSPNVKRSALKVKVAELLETSQSKRDLKLAYEMQAKFLLGHEPSTGNAR